MICSDRTQAASPGFKSSRTQMPTRYRPDLRCTDNTLTRAVRGPGRHTTVAQCEEREKQQDWKLWRLGRDPGTLVDHCVSLDTVRRRRRKGAEEDGSSRFGATRHGVYADGGARDPSVLSCSKCSPCEAKGGYPKFKDQSSKSNG